jgi:hypothetical protein
MSLEWIALQLQIRASRTFGLGLQVPRYNPRPAGVIRPGSATHAVLGYLQKHSHWLNHRQICSGTGCTSHAVDWGLIFLKSQGLIECASDDGRNPRYLRYRIIK